MLLDRLGSIDPAHLAGVDEAALQAAAKGPPAIHRFPSAMAKRVRELATYVRDTYDGDAARLWTDASDARDLKKRIAALPGFGDMKVASLYAVLVRQLGIDLPGAQDELPSHPTLGDVDSAEALANYQATKRAHKAELGAARRRRRLSDRPVARPVMACAPSAIRRSQWRLNETCRRSPPLGKVGRSALAGGRA